MEKKIAGRYPLGVEFSIDGKIAVSVYDWYKMEH